LFEKINKIDKPLTKLIKRKRRHKLIKLEIFIKGEIITVIIKYRVSLGNTLKTYIPIN
jgi:hypothetical protein